ncbi:cellobiose dehydrogenase [Apiospora kogelbergensis]|uniref:cellobiose dehydrogenase n=1 Tax=Apiospora kogelbergensis TaxID=1337665 RepID=UPI003131E88C
MSLHSILLPSWVLNEKDNPPEVAGNLSTKPITKSTSVNSTFLTYTLLCEGCLGAQPGLHPNANTGKGGSVDMGWAISSNPVTNLGSSVGVLAFHNVGEGVAPRRT